MPYITVGSGTDWRGAAVDAEDSRQPRRPADGSVRPDPRQRRSRPLAVLERPQHAVLRIQPAGSQSF
jgi:hypothetical protein